MKKSCVFWLLCVLLVLLVVSCASEENAVEVAKQTLQAEAVETAVFGTAVAEVAKQTVEAVPTEVSVPPTTVPDTPAPTPVSEVPTLASEVPEPAPTVYPPTAVPASADEIVLLRIWTKTGPSSAKRNRHSIGGIGGIDDGPGTNDKVLFVLEAQTAVLDFDLDRPDPWDDREADILDEYEFNDISLFRGTTLSEITRVGFRKEEASVTTKKDGDWYLLEFYVTVQLANGEFYTMAQGATTWFSTGDMSTHMWKANFEPGQ